jgi:hypothetical protein
MVQNSITGSYMLPSAGDKKKDQRIKREGTRKTKRKEVIYKEA